MAEQYIYHLIGKEEWSTAKQKGFLKPDSLQKEGFIHFCEKKKIETVLEFENKPEEELVALKVKRSQVEKDLNYENDFPHLYRELEAQEVEETKILTKVDYIENKED